MARSTVGNGWLFFANEMVREVDQPDGSLCRLSESLDDPKGHTLPSLTFGRSQKSHDSNDDQCLLKHGPLL
jgi:hypothetical protein